MKINTTELIKQKHLKEFLNKRIKVKTPFKNNSIKIKYKNEEIDGRKFSSVSGTMFDICLREIFINKKLYKYEDLEKNKELFFKKTEEELFKKTGKKIERQNIDIIFEEFKNLYKLSEELIKSIDLNKITKIINPTYGLNIENCICGDGDYIINNVITDCKTTIQYKNSYFLKDIRQQLIYHMLNTIKIFLGEENYKLKNEIHLIYIRFLKIEKYKIEDIINIQDYKDITNRLYLFLLDKLKLNDFGIEIETNKELNLFIENIFDLNISEEDKDIEKLSEKEIKLNELYKKVNELVKDFKSHSNITDKNIHIQIKSFESFLNKLSSIEKAISEMREEQKEAKEEIETINRKLNELYKIFNKKIEVLTEVEEKKLNEEKRKTGKIIFSMFIFNLITISSIILYMIYFN